MVWEVGCSSVTLVILVLAIIIINNSNNQWSYKGPRLDKQGLSLLCIWVDPELASPSGWCNPKEPHGISFSKELLPHASAS